MSTFFQYRGVRVYGLQWRLTSLHRRNAGEMGRDRIVGIDLIGALRDNRQKRYPVRWDLGGERGSDHPGVPQSISI